MWNIPAAFRAELRKPVHYPTIKAVVLTPDFEPVTGGEFFDKGTRSEIQNFIVDGNVDVDTERGTRRTATMTLMNQSGDFTPTSKWTGKFYINRIFRLYRGVVVGDDKLYAPIGTFMIDHAEIIVERNQSVVVVSASDLWKKLSKSIFTAPKSYAAGTHINTVIRNMALMAGAHLPLAPALDPLVGPERTTENTTLQVKHTYERGDNRGEKLRELCDQFGIDIFFDVTGRLTTNDRKDPKDLASVWTFSDAADGTGMLISASRSFNDDYLYNHVIAVATGDPKNILTFEIKDVDPRSITSIQTIGDRVMIIENDKWKTQGQVNAAARLAWSRRFGINEEVSIQTICNPALDGDDVIYILESKAEIQSRYRIRSLNVPLTTALQTIKIANYVRR